MSLSVVASSLLCNNEGILEVLLLQAPSGFDLVGRRDGFVSRKEEPREPSAEDIANCEALLDQSKPGTITVMSFHPGLRGGSERLASLGKDRTIVGLEGIVPGKHNMTVVATGDAVYHTAKSSLSTEDVCSEIQPGNEFRVFLPEKDNGAVRWAVFNCHDYSHVDLVHLIEQHRLELVVIVTMNAAIRLFWQYAIADVHRFCCYVVIANVSELGGSGVFAPFRRIGREIGAQIAAGGEIFVSRGPAELSVRVNLDIGQLRKIRVDFAARGFQAIEDSRAAATTPMVPSEHYMATHDRGAGAPPVQGVNEVPMDWVRERFRVAIAQFRSIGTDAYVDSRYRIRDHPDCAAFEKLLALRLQELAHRCEQQKERQGELDLLLFPEVFVPRTFLGVLQEFSDQHRTTVIAGVDYPDGPIAANANECAIIRPRAEAMFYRKITRSQYDAKTQGHERMLMNRGDRLVRFVDPFKHGFGVLICYDYSHFDLMHRLNLDGRALPLELVAVVAHNPFADLYRWCCLADSHRFYQFVMMCNVAEYGGSGIFAPMRTPGARQVLAEAGKGAESMILTELPLGELIRARETDDAKLHRGGRFMRRPGVFQRRWP
jgi:predicted amidohydrolase